MSDERPTIHAVTTANRRFVEFEVRDQATTTTILLTPEETDDLIEQAQEARAACAP